MRTNNPRDRLANNLRQFVGRANLANRERATLGWRKSDTEVTLRVPGQRNFLYCTKPDQTIFKARNDANVPLNALLPVWVELQHDSYVIVARDMSNASVLIPDGDYGVPPHPLEAHSDVDSDEALAVGDLLQRGVDEWLTVAPDELVAATVDAATEQTTPEDTNAIPLTDTGVLKWISWANIKVALNAIYGRLAVANTWTAAQTIVGANAAGIQHYVRAASGQTAAIAAWANNAGSTIYTYIDSIGRIRGTAGMYVHNAYYALLGEQTFDPSMTGMYDRNELENAGLRGVITVTITGAGTYTNTTAEKNKLVAGVPGNYFTISGTDITTTKIEIVFDMLSSQPNYSQPYWGPFVQYRLLIGPSATATWYKKITVEMSADNATWYKPLTGNWETTDAAADQIANGYWFGTFNNALFGLNNYRYVRFTLEDRQEDAGYAFKDFVWISQVGFRHRNAPWSRRYTKNAGDDLYGDYRLVPSGAAATAYNTIIRQDGSAVFNEQGANVDFRVEGDTDANTFFVDASADAVGVKTNTPQEALDVNGFVRHTGRKRVTSAFNKTNTTLADVTGLSVTVGAGKSYTFRTTLFVDANGTGGGKYAIAGTATATSIIYHIDAINDATGAHVITSRQTALAGSAGQAGATALKVVIEGQIVVNAGGTLTVQFAQNAASGTSTVLAGSHFEVEAVA